MTLVERIAAALGEPDISLHELSSGASYGSFRVTAAGRPIALARVDPGSHRPGTEHLGLSNEAALIGAAGRAGVPVPRVLAHLAGSARSSVTGRFEPDVLLVEWLEGEALGHRIVRQPDFAPARRRFARQAGEILARVHASEPQEVSLPFVEPAAFVSDAHTRYRGLGTPRPVLDAVARRLLDTAPDAGSPTVVHGDYRLGNLMVDPTEGIVGVLDWELACRSDPHRDLGYLLLNSWRFGGAEEVGGCGTVRDLVDAYEESSGRRVDLGRLRWWQAAGSFWWGVTCLSQAERFDGTIETVAYAGIGPRVSEAESDCCDLLVPEIHRAVVAESDPPEPTGARSSANEIRLVEAARTLLGAQSRTFERLVVERSLGVVERTLRWGPDVRREELESAATLLDRTFDDVAAARAVLSDALWRGDLRIDDPSVAAHLCTMTHRALEIDQPGYRTADRTGAAQPVSASGT